MAVFCEHSNKIYIFQSVYYNICVRLLANITEKKCDEPPGI
jgi:hypothetical protein